MTSGTSAEKTAFGNALTCTRRILDAKKILDVKPDDAIASKQLTSSFLELTSELIILGVSVQPDANLPATEVTYQTDGIGKPTKVLAQPLTEKRDKV